MKYLLLVLKNMKSFILGRTVFLIIFICGQVVAMATILTATGTAQMTFNEDKNTNLYVSGVKFELGLCNTDVEISGQEWIEKVNILKEYMGENMDSIEMVSWTKGDEKTRVFTMYCTEESYSALPKGKEMFTYEELMGDNHLIIMKNSKEEVQAGTEIELAGETYTVKGCKNLIEPMVPIGAVPKQNIVYSTTLWTANTITKGKAEEIEKEIHKVFETDAKVDVMSGSDLVDLQANNTGKYAVAFAAVIILLNSFVCYRYILEYRRKWLGIVRMLGCSVNRAFGIYEGELMIMLLFCSVVGTALFRSVIYPVMYNRSSMYEEIYSAPTYAFSIILYMVTAFIIITACIIPLVSKSVIELKNRS